MPYTVPHSGMTCIELQILVIEQVTCTPRHDIDLVPQVGWTWESCSQWMMYFFHDDQPPGILQWLDRSHEPLDNFETRYDSWLFFHYLQVSGTVRISLQFATMLMMKQIIRLWQGACHSYAARIGAMSIHVLLNGPRHSFKSLVWPWSCILVHQNMLS